MVELCRTIDLVSNRPLHDLIIVDCPCIDIPAGCAGVFAESLAFGPVEDGV